MILCYLVAAGYDFQQRSWKAAILAAGFGAMNAIIFLWRD